MVTRALRLIGPYREGSLVAGFRDLMVWRVTVPAGSRSLTAARARWQQLHGRGEARAGDPVEQSGAGPLAEQVHRLADRRELRIGQADGIEVVETGHGYLVRDADAGCGEGPQDPDRHLIVGAHGVRELRGALQAAVACPLAAADGEGSLHRADELAVRAAAQQASGFCWGAG
jgi:hypothetical protein